MTIHPIQAIHLLSVDQILERHPLVVAPDTTVSATVEYMSRTVGEVCHLNGSEAKEDLDRAYFNCALVVASGRLLGIFSERDLVRLVADGTDLDRTPVSQVMSQPVISLKRAGIQSIFSVLATLRQHRIRQVPVLDDAGEIVGLITQTSIRQAMQPLSFLKLRRIGEVMSQVVVQGRRTESLLSIARRMAARQVSCVVITDPTGLSNDARSSTDIVLARPIGIVTERDIVQFRMMGLSLERTLAEAVMSAPLFLVRPEDSLWTAHQQMQQRRTRRLVVADNLGYLAGIVTQTSLLHPLDPAVLLSEVEQMQQVVNGQATELSEANRKLQVELAERKRLEAELKQANQQLEMRLGQQAAQLVQSEGALGQATQKRQQAQHELEQFFAVTPSLLCIAGLDGYFKRLNPLFSQVLGFSEDELMAEPFVSFVHPEDRLATDQAVEGLAAGKATSAFENRYRCKDGTYRWLSWNSVADLARGFIYAAARDITAVRQSKQALQQQSQQSQLLSRLTREVRDSLEIDDIVQSAVKGLQAILGCDRALVIERSDAEAHLSSSYQLASETVQTCVCDDLSQQSCSSLSKAFLCQHQLQASLEAKIYVQQQFWGLLVAGYADHPYQWQSFEVELTRQLADQLGVAISHAQLLTKLEHQVTQRTEQLQQEVQERIQVEDALRENEQRLSGILANADEAIISINQQQQIVMYNQGAERIFGYTAQESLGQSLDLLLPDAFRVIHRQHVERFGAATERARQMAERNRDVYGQRKSGEMFPAEASISKLMTKDGLLFTVMLKDITQRRQSELALQRSEERLRLTANALPVLICYIDSEHRYRFNNKTYEEWFGYSAAELQGRTVQQVKGKAYYQRARPYIARALSGEQVEYETSLTFPDGARRDLLVTYIPDVGEGGQIKGCFGLVSDISDRKATERIKNEFISIVSHELRTPLTSIHGSLKLLATGQLGTLLPQGQEVLNIAITNTERLTRLINDVLDLERIESGRVSLVPQSCSLMQLMQEATQTMAAMADERGIQLQVVPTQATVWADADHVLQTLTNLLSNAIKFSPAGTVVQVDAADCDPDMSVCVTDQGRGIPADKLELIFERFQQVDASDSRQRGGTGLGLAICKQIVQRHGGKIWAESTLGEGSQIFFTLPKGDPSKKRVLMVTNE